MQLNKLGQMISLVQQNNNEIARTKLIKHYKSYITNTASQICKRYITWSDEESSIGLLAFNRAIDTFDPEAGRSFLNYVYLLIQRDLIDYFRKENRNSQLSLDYTASQEQTAVSEAEIEHSLQSFQASNEKDDLIHEILELDASLQDFNIKFEELEDCSPKHRDTRDALNEMATHFIHLKTLTDAFAGKKKFPVSAFVKQTGYRIKTIERHRKYLITLILIKLHPEWVHLSSFMITDDKARDEA
jgi:RNA polymerase sigma factor